MGGGVLCRGGGWGERGGAGQDRNTIFLGGCQWCVCVCLGWCVLGEGMKRQKEREITRVSVKVGCDCVNYILEVLSTLFRSCLLQSEVASAQVAVHQTPPLL